MRIVVVALVCALLGACASTGGVKHHSDPSTFGGDTAKPVRR